MDFAAGGGHPHSRAYECFGADHKITHELMVEALEIIRRAWSEETLNFTGRYFRIPEVVVNPKPAQRPLPSFYMATSSLDGVAVGARLGVNLLLPIHTRTPEQVIEYSRAYWQGLETYGHDPTSRELGLLVPMHLASSTARARARSEAGVMSYFKTIADMRNDYVDWLTRRGDELPVRLRTTSGASVSFDDICERHAVIGNTESTLHRLKALSAATGATNLLTWFNIGNVPHALVQESMRQFAAEVMPYL
jgi:alkanesulfonate monooxygenase SsuD/methylene tetrahydromethanopterin reductase-like flavin-dependent oxidoreductase (luciferase family)